jgi:hypothetical protein
MNMSLKAIIATLVLGSSSVALAAPTVRDHRTPVQTRFAVRSIAPAPAPGALAHFGLGAHRPRPQRLTWVSLASNMAVSGRIVIDVSPAQRAFTKLELRAEGKGKTSIDKVLIVYGNGRTQTVELDAKLTKRQPTLAIDLAGDSRTIDKIVLVGRSNGRNALVDVFAI